MAKQHMLTTLDNPFNPHTQFRQWYAYDEAMGYATSGLLARIATTSNELSDKDQELAIESAIDEIIKENVLGIYKKI